MVCDGHDTPFTLERIEGYAAARSAKAHPSVASNIDDGRVFALESASFSKRSIASVDGARCYAEPSIGGNERLVPGCTNLRHC